MPFALLAILLELVTLAAVLIALFFLVKGWL